MDIPTFGVLKAVVESEADSQLKKLMIYGSLHGPGTAPILRA